VRLFAASFLGPSNQRAYRQLTEDLSRCQPGLLRSVPDGTIHITFAFIPDVDEAGLPVLTAAVQQVSASHHPIEIRLGLPRVQFGGASPRLVCADLIAGAESMRRLTAVVADRLAAAIPDAEVRASKSPHVTLARFRKHCTRGDARLLTRHLAEEAVGLEVRDRVDRVALVASVLTSGGPVYEVKGECPLGC
jgi:2'-5' RNA ligase